MPNPKSLPRRAPPSATNRNNPVTPADTSVRFTELYSRYYQQVYSYCRRRVSPDHVDDLVSDVFIAVWKRIHDAPPTEVALPWIYRIAFHRTGNHWRARSRRKSLQTRLEAVGAAEVVPPIADQIVVRDDVREVLDVASRLSAPDLEVLRLSLWEQLSNLEIAEVLELKPNAVKQRLHRAKKRLIAEYERTTGNSAVPLEEPEGDEL